jgi:hypothetical protein
MKEIQRYHYVDDGGPFPLATSPNGTGCRWSDVEALQKELVETTAKALAAVWLIPEDQNIAGLKDLYDEARRTLMGGDKKTIAKLQDDLRYAQEAYQHAVRPERPGINMVYGVNPKNPDLRTVLMLTVVHRDTNGGLVVEVQLP